MAGTTDQPPYSPDPRDPRFFDAEPDDAVPHDDDLDHDDADGDRPRRRIPAWLLPTVAALVVGLLIGSFFFGGSDATARPTAAVPTDASGQPVPHRADIDQLKVRAQPVLQLLIQALEPCQLLWRRWGR